MQHESVQRSRPKDRRKQYPNSEKKGRAIVVNISDESIAAIQQALSALPPPHRRRLNAKPNGGSQYATPASSLLTSAHGSIEERTSALSTGRSMEAADANGTSRSTAGEAWHLSRGAEGTSSHDSRRATTRFVLDLDLPEGEYLEGPDGSFRCRPCKKGFADILSYVRHLKDSSRHGGTMGLRHKKAVPPKLVRYSPPPLSARPLVAANGQIPETTSAHQTPVAPSGSSGSRTSTSRITGTRCSACDLAYTNPAALQRHYATQTDAHPFYCPDCMTDYDSASALQAVRLRFR